MNNKVKKNVEIFDIKHFGKRLMLYSTVVGSLMIICFPMLYIVLASFKSGADLSAVPPTLFPTEWTYGNYVELFRQSDFVTYFKNSVILAIIATALSIILGAVGAYSLSRFPFRPIQVFGSISLLSYMLPEVLIVIPLYVYVVNPGYKSTISSHPHS